MADDQEIAAMGKVLDALGGLEQEERRRVLQWAMQKFDLSLKSGTSSPTGASNSDESVAYSTDTIATALGAKSGSDVVMAAAGHLHFAQNKQKFTRQELISEMKSAPAYFKDTYINNLSTYLMGLTKADRLRLVSSNTYALSNKERQEFTKIFASLG